MRIPVKITPDRIRDSIVQVFFQSSVPFEALIGVFYTTLLNSGWKYANRPNQPLQPKKIVIEFTAGPQHFFIKDNVRFQLFPNQSIAFNCNNSYIGWGNYSNYINEVLTEISKTNYLTRFSRIGIRYISEFANIDIFEKIKIKVDIPFAENKVSNSSHRMTLIEGDITKTINIASKIPANTNLTGEMEYVNYISLLDIDVVKKNLSVNDISILWDEINNVHTIEKEIFFGLLREEFLQTLNPQYA